MISLEDVDETVVVVVVVVILWALKVLWEFGINDPWEIVILLPPAMSATREDCGGSCEFLPNSTNCKNLIKRIINVKVFYNDFNRMRHTIYTIFFHKF